MRSRIRLSLMVTAALAVHSTEPTTTASCALAREKSATPGASDKTDETDKRQGDGSAGPTKEKEKDKQKAKDKDKDSDKEKKSYYVPTRGYRLEPQPDIPPYVRNLGKTYEAFKGVDWLNIGLDSRARFEYRKDDYRPWLDTSVDPPVSRRKYFPNSLWLERTRVYFGVQNIIDPFRFVVEFQDSRAFNSIYEYQGQEINQNDLISGYGELYFKDAFGTDDLGNDRPLILRAGRFHLELLDRRLIAENEFRNTTNTFEGFRLKIGKRENDFEIDSFVMRPVVRYPYSFDRADWANWIYGSVFNIRRWSKYATVQPYFLGRQQYADPGNVSASARVHRRTYAPGLRAYGVLGDFDYDFDVNKQLGEIGEYQTVLGRQSPFETTVRHDAIAYAFELGYTFSDHPWKPRFSANYAYGTGNISPFDNANQNFDIFYGFNQPFSRNDYIAWNNVKAPKARIEFTPFPDVYVDTAFSAYWLASAASAWDRANLYAPLGNRGAFLGTEYDLRIRHKLSPFVNLTASYARFWPGSFPASFAPPVALQPYFPQSFPGQTTTTNGLTARPTDFFYLEAQANAFGDGKPIPDSTVAELFGVTAPFAPPPPPPSWTDVYVGLNGGGAWSNPVSDGWASPMGPARASAAVAQLGTMIDRRNHLAGFVGGFQLGFNNRLDGGVLAGVEADLRGVSGNTDAKWRAGVIRAGGLDFLTYGQQTATLNYLGTIRGRLGYLATPTLAIYGTGGLAYGGVVSSAAVVAQRIGAVDQTLVSPVNQGSFVGWTVGGGVEWSVTPHWSVKVDFLHYDLGRATASAFGAQRNGLFDYAVSSSTHFRGDLIQAGVNRRFELFEPQVKK
jgi:opacity protein-like surface antigen